MRRALGDFGVPIAIVMTVLLDYWAEDTYTEKLRVPNGLQVCRLCIGIQTRCRFSGLPDQAVVFLFDFSREK